MKAGSHSELRSAFLLSLFLCALVFSFKILQISAQNPPPCSTPPILPGHPKWKQGAQVTVYFK